MDNDLIKRVVFDNQNISFLNSQNKILTTLAINKISNCEVLEEDLLFQKSKSPVLRTLFGNIFFGNLGGILCGLTSLIPSYKTKRVKFFKISSPILSEDIIFSADNKTIHEIQKRIIENK